MTGHAVIQDACAVHVWRLQALNTNANTSVSPHECIAEKLTLGAKNFPIMENYVVRLFGEGSSLLNERLIYLVVSIVNLYRLVFLSILFSGCRCDASRVLWNDLYCRRQKFRLGIHAEEGIEEYSELVSLFHSWTWITPVLLFRWNVWMKLEPIEAYRR